MDKLSQAKIHETSSPPNIYSATVMRMVDGNEKIIMVSSKTDIITLESKTVNDKVVTFTVKLDFSNIPSKAEIIAIRCINRSKEFDDFVIGITYESIVEDQNSDMYFNVYSGFPGSSLESIMDNCETLKLNFNPFQLTYASYLCRTRIKGMWLLSGSDTKIHAYKCDEQQICEQKIEKYFVEFGDKNFDYWNFQMKPSNILCFGTKTYSNYTKRISFFGCDTGYLVLAILNSKMNQILYNFVEHYQSPITVVQLFNIYNRKDDFTPDCNTINEKEPVCLLVASATECAVVYMDVLISNLGCGVILPNSDQYKTITTSLITDVNFDSKNEILLGTYGDHILNYAYKNNTWVELQSLDVRHPVYTICYLDISGDGVKDAVIMSEIGIHIFKHEPKDIIKILKNRLKP